MRSNGKVTPLARVLFSAFLVSVVAWVLRFPSCGESLWVDELHTAWVVAGSLRDVSARAALGNQTPWYFWGLWYWQQFFGNSEPLLRLPSVAAVSFASGLLVWIGWRVSCRWILAVLAGMFLAVDVSALFFGTEARAYGFVILAVTVFIACLVEIDRGTRFRSLWWSVLFASTTISILMHITSSLVFVCLAAAYGLLASLPFRDKAEVALATGAGTVAGLAISWSSITRVWGIRQQWDSFGKTETMFDLVSIWPWLWMLVLPVVGTMLVPLTVAVLGRGSQSQRLQGDQASSYLRVAVYCWCVVLAVTLGGWWISYFEIASIWHRRFLVGLLPLIFLGGAGLWCRAIESLAPLSRSSSLQFFSALLVLAGFAVSQGRVSAIFEGETRLVRRQEDWRSATRFLKERRDERDDVWVAAELIESNWLDDTSELAALTKQQQEDYLRFPVSGIYDVPESVPMGHLQSSASQRRILGWYRSRSVPGGRLWIIARASRANLRRFSGSLADKLKRQGEGAVELIPFRKVTLILIQ
jgi:mannosyltransferase